MRRHSGSGQRRRRAFQHVARHVVVGDNKNLGAGPQRRNPRAERGNNAAPDDDLIAARAERDFDESGIAANRCRHAPSSFRRQVVAIQKAGERAHDFDHDRIVRHLARLHGDIGLRIDRLALGQQLAQGRGRIGGHQHRPVLLAFVDPPHQHVELGG